MTTDKKLSLLFISRKYITINANLELINTNILTFNWIWHSFTHSSRSIKLFANKVTFIRIYTQSFAWKGIK